MCMVRGTVQAASCFKGAQLLGAAALIPLSASALSFDIIQGDVFSQADVGTEGLPEPLTEERVLPCGRWSREEEVAIQLFPVDWFRLYSHRWGYRLDREWAIPP